jgi:hypothetical protein
MSVGLKDMVVICNASKVILSLEFYVIQIKREERRG